MIFHVGATFTVGSSHTKTVRAVEGEVTADLQLGREYYLRRFDWLKKAGRCAKLTRHAVERRIRGRSAVAVAHHCIT